MNPSVKTALAALLPIALLGAVACDKKTDAPKPATTAELPADVASLATAAAAPAAEPAASPESAASAAVASDGTIEATGELASPSRSELVCRQPGRVARILTDEGKRVTEGQALLELESDYLRLDSERAGAELARATAARDDAKRDLARKEELRGKQAVSEAVFERTRAAAQQAEAAREAAAAAAALAKQRLDDSVLRAPFTGVIAERHADVGERLGDATIAFVLVRTAPLRLRFQVPERHLAQVKVGQVVRASVDPYPGKTFVGHVSTVGGVVDAKSRTFLVESEFPNGDGALRPGLFARVSLEARK